MMTDPANDIVKQASQGSVAAIIQILNERLADSGVRTRAMLDDKGVLQLLCEALTPEQLEKSVLVDRICRILEYLAPSNIRRVNLNSRIVREQQLLWLDEINRDPIGQLLWSQEVVLKKPNLLQRFQRAWKNNQERAAQPLAVRSPRQLREQQQFWRGGFVGGVSAAALLLAGWLLYSKFASSPAEQIQATTSQSNSSAASQVNGTAALPSVPPPATKSDDPFAEAVRLAEQASQAGLSAKSPDEWRDLATRWQTASELMASVPQQDDRYATAQDRVNRYRENSQSALQKATQY